MSKTKVYSRQVSAEVMKDLYENYGEVGLTNTYGEEILISSFRVEENFGEFSKLIGAPQEEIQNQNYFLLYI